MVTKFGFAAVIALIVWAPASGAQGKARHHVYARHAARAEVPPVASGNAQYDVIRRATERAQTEPGITNELAPDSRQTATGGPVGGVPGYDGM